MLILTRKKDETMVVGHDVTVKVLGVSGNQVKIGIEAPREVSIMRDELLDTPRDGEEQAAGQVKRDKSGD